MWKLSIEDDQSNRTVVNLVRKEYTLGRAEENAIRLTERNISRKHARLLRDSDGWRLIDLASYTGCFVNGQRVEGERRLSHGDSIRLGDYILTLTDSTQEMVLTPPGNPDQLETIPVTPAVGSGERADRLVIVEGPNPGTQLPLLGLNVLIGRGEECDVILNDTSVSRVHARIEQLTDGVYQLHDQGSSNGVRINGGEVKSQVLNPFDRIELGDVLLQFVPRGQSLDVQALEQGAFTRPSSTTRLIDRFRSDPKLAASAALGGLLFGLALFGLSGPGEAEDTGDTRSPARRALDQARAQLEQGDVDGAHEVLRTIDGESNLRQSPLFQQIEAQWADHQFQRAHQAQNPVEERRILERIAQSPSVDSLRRKRAADLIAQLSEANLRPSDLPKATEGDAGARSDGADQDSLVHDSSEPKAQEAREERAAHRAVTRPRVPPASEPNAAPRPVKKPDPSPPTPAEPTVRQPKPTAPLREPGETSAPAPIEERKPPPPAPPIELE